jgi:ATP-dependent DNA helicase DinG
VEVSVLSDNPSDYGLPYPEWNPRQDEMCEKALNLDEGQFLMLEAPCGLGKSGVPGLVSHFRPGTTVLVRSIDLQNQYSATIPFFKSLWGRARDPNLCVHPEVIDTFQTIYDAKPYRIDCPYRKPKDECDYYSECPYEVAKAAVVDARARVLNYSFAFYCQWWRGITEDLFCDEAHELITTLSGLISINISDRTRQAFDLPEFQLAIGRSPFALRITKEWLGKAINAILPFTKSKDIKVKREAEWNRERFQNLSRVLERDDDYGNWYVQSKPGDRMTLKPIVPGEHAQRILIPKARSVTLMSATLGNPIVLVRWLGIPLDGYEYISLPHAFPAENRRVYLPKGAPKLSYRSKSKDYEKQMGLMHDILEAHKDERGIVHTASWHHSHMIADAIKGNGRRVMLPDPGRRLGSIQDFKDSPPGTIAVSPSWATGLNFPYDECRFAIIAKMPFRPYNDPIVKARLELPGGRDWYDWECCQQVVQAANRGVRFADDKCTTYILDRNWSRVKRMAPQWFKVDEVKEI